MYQSLPGPDQMQLLSYPITGQASTATSMSATVSISSSSGNRGLVAVIATARQILNSFTIDHNWVTTIDSLS